MKTEAGQVIADRLNKPMEFMIVRRHTYDRCYDTNTYSASCGTLCIIAYL